MDKARLSNLWGKSSVFFVVLALLLIGSGAAGGKTIHVKVGGTGHGSSSATAYGDLQTALDDADPNWEDRDWEKYEAVLSGHLLGNDVEVGDPCDLIDDPCRVDNCYNVIYHPNDTNLDSTALLDGFVITGVNSSGTPEASKSYFDKPPCGTIVAGDINGDCKVDFKDFALMALHWLEDNNKLN